MKTALTGSSSTVAPPPVGFVPCGQYAATVYSLPGDMTAGCPTCWVTVRAAAPAPGLADEGPPSAQADGTATGRATANSTAVSAVVRTDPMARPLLDAVVKGHLYPAPPSSEVTSTQMHQPIHLHTLDTQALKANVTAG